ncbi:MAG: site-specific DNA-methyltransferase [Candidatus Moeniiplasma glomeromycotorum]|nr:site-specific DNA-methyltransferase [Candidatus Moeniiplasma glomeromycotorum]MCE8167205.1 site-specific DNA-methyltransferase [Candidatus Moeniiplasma glomeromycotorum]MCE8168782.1 site-specific DNA-methyltransferase [Candidatus Moeniiplasma glomeromycotorum]
MIQNNNKLSGKLELNWVNKNKTLIVSDYEKIKYEWVDPNDYRISEVRLFKEVEIYSANKPSLSVGEQTRSAEQKFGEKNTNSFIQNSSDNLIICGDSLNALTSLSKIPEYRQKYVNKVKLIYIDPPFNTGQMFTNYDDQLEHSVWLTMMRDRTLKAYELLSDDGSLWVHLDDTELYHFKLVLDEIFGKENFISSVIWEKRPNILMDAHQFSNSHDTILVYAKDTNWKPNFSEAEADLKRFSLSGGRIRRVFTEPKQMVIRENSEGLNYYGTRFVEPLKIFTFRPVKKLSSMGGSRDSFYYQFSYLDLVSQLQKSFLVDSGWRKKEFRRIISQTHSPPCLWLRRGERVDFLVGVG